MHALTIHECTSMFQGTAPHVKEINGPLDCGGQQLAEPGAIQTRHSCPGYIYKELSTPHHSQVVEARMIVLHELFTKESLNADTQDAAEGRSQMNLCRRIPRQPLTAELALWSRVVERALSSSTSVKCYTRQQQANLCPA